MDIMDIASKGIVAITKNFGKKICKKETAPEIEKVAPVIIDGEGYRVGFSTDEIMPDLDSGKTYWIKWKEYLLPFISAQSGLTAVMMKVCSGLARI